MRTQNRRPSWCLSAGLVLVLVGGAAGQPAAKPATGTLTLGDNTYPLTNALAYETMRSNRKETVVVLSAKALDTTRLKQSLTKNSTDEDFVPLGAHVKLRFDEKGAIAQTGIHADGANIISSGDANIKVTATIKDGTAKGKAGMDKPGDFFKKAYQFEVTFEVAVIQLAGSTAKPPVDPKTKTTPIDPKPALVTDKELRFDGKLAHNDSTVMGKPAKIHTVKMSPDKTYIIDMESKDFDAYLRILDAGGKQLASDDDGGEGLNSRLRFTPTKEGDYQVVATSFGSGQGNYLLKIRVVQQADTKIKPGEPLVATEKESSVEGKLANDSPMVMGKPAQVHSAKLSADKTYLLDLESKDFDAYLRILDATGKQLAYDDDSGNNRNARLRFTPPRDGDYQIVATRFGSGQGNYLLKIRVLRAGEEK